MLPGHLPLSNLETLRSLPVFTNMFNHHDFSPISYFSCGLREYLTPGLNCFIKEPHRGYRLPMDSEHLTGPTGSNTDKPGV